MDNPRPIFVIGSPRSGTTMMGEYMATHQDILYLGEYAGFDFMYRIAQNELGGMPSTYIQNYLTQIQNHARSFPEKLAKEENKKWFCDAAPWNLLSAESIVENNPDAVYLVCCRSVHGVTQSLERSYNQGYLWAGADFSARVALWKNFYSQIQYLPKEQTVFFNYDNFCARPVEVLNNLDNDFQAITGLAPLFDRSIFAQSHATKPNTKRDTIAYFGESRQVIFNPIEAFDKRTWVEEFDSILRDDPAYQSISAHMKNVLRFI